jgi:hypothetical protein
MSLKSTIFKTDIQESSDGNLIHFINIEEIDNNIEEFIEEQIVSIWDGNNGSPIDVVKIEISNYLKTKSEDIIKGSIAEFIVHLYLKSYGFSQECLFKNLEEGSIKKGFDGYYTYSNEEWIMESKSGSINTTGISHKAKINEAYNDLKSKIEGKATNNPWSNAYSHAVLAGTTKDIIKNIKNLSNNYVNKTYPDIKKLNIIPSSTIFYEGKWDASTTLSNHKVISDQNEKFDYCKINVICINKKSIDVVIEKITK